MAFCSVTGIVLNGSGSAVTESPVRAHLAEGDDPKFDDDGNLITNSSVQTLSDGAGAFALQLIQGVTYTIDIEDANYHRRVTIPNQANVELKDLI
jgi:hypothetical protein